MGVGVIIYMKTYRVGDNVLLKNNWLSNCGREATIIKDDGGGYFYVHVEETSTSMFADGHDLWTHESMFLPLPE